MWHVLGLTFKFLMILGAVAFLAWLICALIGAYTIAQQRSDRFHRGYRVGGSLK
jgi:hypothetical protein